MTRPPKSEADRKNEDLERNRSRAEDRFLSTDQGVRISDDQNSLTAGERGPSLLEDFILREKITHLDHERIPERVVHARGTAAHGYFQVYESQSSLTEAGFLQAGADMGGFKSHAPALHGKTTHGRSDKFFDHFSQARLFFDSLADWEQAHVVQALQFELGKLQTPTVADPQMLHLLCEAYPHCKTIAATGEGCSVVATSFEGLPSGSVAEDDPGIVLGPADNFDSLATDFMYAVAQHRHWHRETRRPLQA